MTREQEQEKDFIDVLTRKLRLKLTVKPHPIDEYANKLIAANRRDHARTTEAQAKAAICRGC